MRLKNDYDPKYRNSDLDSSWGFYEDESAYDDDDWDDEDEYYEWDYDTDD